MSHTSHWTCQTKFSCSIKTNIHTCKPTSTTHCNLEVTPKALHAAGAATYRRYSVASFSRNYVKSHIPYITSDLPNQVLSTIKTIIHTCWPLGRSHCSLDFKSNAARCRCCYLEKIISSVVWQILYEITCPIHTIGPAKPSAATRSRQSFIHASL
jgi:hypothetical protein